MHNQDAYDDIINLPRPELRFHHPMPMEKRAAQFSPFKAMTGYEDMVDEEVRFTDDFILLDEDVREEIAWQMGIIEEKLKNGDEARARVTWFIPDEKKHGGSYRTETGRIKKIDPIERILTLEDGERIPADHVMGLEAME